MYDLSASEMKGWPLEEMAF